MSYHRRQEQHGSQRFKSDQLSDHVSRVVFRKPETQGDVANGRVTNANLGTSEKIYLRDKETLSPADIRRQGTPNKCL